MKNSTLKFFRIPTLLIASVGIFSSMQLTAAPKRYDYAEDTNTALREVRAGIDDLKHEVSNHENEIRTFESKLTNQEATLDSLRQHIMDATQINKELVRNSSNNLETKLNSFEPKIVNLDNLIKGLVADMKQLRTHANDVSTSFERYEQRISNLERIIEVQNRNIANMEKALTSIASAFEVKTAPVTSERSKDNLVVSSDKIYRVKPGDSLEKIAKANGTTIKAIKELNQISNDRIFVGQKLQLP